MEWLSIKNKGEMVMFVIEVLLFIIKVWFKIGIIIILRALLIPHDPYFSGSIFKIFG